jgi:hypothetical protein
VTLRPPGGVSSVFDEQCRASENPPCAHRILCSGWGARTIWGRSRESFPIVLKTRSCSLLTMLRSSSPSDAIALVCVCVCVCVRYFAPDGSGLLSNSQTAPRGYAEYAMSRCRCVSVSWSAEESAEVIVADGGSSLGQEARDESAFAAAPSSLLKVPRFEDRHVQHGISAPTGHSHASLILDFNIRAFA